VKNKGQYHRACRITTVFLFPLTNSSIPIHASEDISTNFKGITEYPQSISLFMRAQRHQVCEPHLYQEILPLVNQSTPRFQLVGRISSFGSSRCRAFKHSTVHQYADKRWRQLGRFIHFFESRASWTDIPSRETLRHFPERWAVTRQRPSRMLLSFRPKLDLRIFYSYPSWTRTQYPMFSNLLSILRMTLTHWILYVIEIAHSDKSFHCIIDQARYNGWGFWPLLQSWSVAQ